jgi:hypothetical protein
MKAIAGGVLEAILMRYFVQQLVESSQRDEVVVNCCLGFCHFGIKNTPTVVFTDGSHPLGGLTLKIEVGNL